MGKGDKRSRRGKIFKASFGKTRPRVKKVSKTPAVTAAPKKPAKKATSKSS